jgi:hypothetical protein
MMDNIKRVFGTIPTGWKATPGFISYLGQAYLDPMWLGYIVCLAGVIMYIAVWVYNFRYPKKKKRPAQQMATLEELFYEDGQDISVWDEYVKRDVKPGDKISDTWDGQGLIWKGQPMRRKPESRDIYIWELMLSDFEPCEDEKPKHGYPEPKKKTTKTPLFNTVYK